MEENIEMMDTMRVTEDDEVVCITKIVTVNGGDQIHLDVNTLREVLTQKDIADLPVAIYSVVGPSRTGKSFLLNLMMRYQNRYQMAQSDLESIESEMLENKFSWKGGADAHTQGLYILKRPFPFKDRDGNQGALFFMDTQGFFDMDTAEQTHRMMGALSFLISSKQIFNVKSRIESTHVEHIVKFAKLAEDIRQKKKECTPFQKQSLIFTVRDWEIKDFQIGFGGGKAYLEKRMEGKKVRAIEHQLKKELLKKTFGEILCYLLPPPESKIREMGEKDDACLISEIGEKFLGMAEELFHHLLAPERISLKEINGKVVSCRQLYDHLDAFTPIINSEDGLEENMQHFLEVAAITDMNHLVQEHSKIFMENLWNNLSIKRNNRQSHQSIFDLMHKDMMEIYDETTTSGVPQLINKFKKVLHDLFKCFYEAIQTGFNAEDLYEEAMCDFKRHLTTITPEHTLMYKNLIEQATDDLKSKAQDLKKKIQEDISDQCYEYFLKEGKQLIDDADKKQTKKIMIRTAVGLGATAAVAAVACPPLIVFGPLSTTVIGIVSGSLAAAAATASATTAIKSSGEDHEVQLASSVFREFSDNDAGVDNDNTKGYSTKFKTEVVLQLKFGKVRFLI